MKRGTAYESLLTKSNHSLGSTVDTLSYRYGAVGRYFFASAPLHHLGPRRYGGNRRRAHRQRHRRDDPFSLCLHNGNSEIENRSRYKSRAYKNFLGTLGLNPRRISYEARTGESH